MGRAGQLVYPKAQVIAAAGFGRVPQPKHVFDVGERVQSARCAGERRVLSREPGEDL